MNYMATVFLMLSLAAVYVVAAPTTDKEIGEDDMLPEILAIQVQLYEFDTDVNFTEENFPLTEENDKNSVENKKVDEELLSHGNDVLSEATEDLSEAKEDLSEAKEDLSEAKEDLSEAKEDLSEAKEDLSEAKEGRSLLLPATGGRGSPHWGCGSGCRLRYCPTCVTERDWAEYLSQLTGLGGERGLSEAKEDLSEAKEDLSEAKEDLSEAKEDLSEAKEDLSEAKEGLSEAKEDLSEAKEDLSEAKGGHSLLLPATGGRGSTYRACSWCITDEHYRLFLKMNGLGGEWGTGR